MFATRRIFAAARRYRARGVRMTGLGLIAAVAPGISSPAAALDRLPVLSLDAAEKAASACRQLATQKAWRMNIAVVDAGANPILFQRMDAAFLASGEIAMRKAKASAGTPFPTRVMEELSFGKDHKGGGAMPGLALAPGVLSIPGGLPIKVGDVLVGAIGVSGSMPDNDELCAQAGLDAIKDLLK
jgi:glc operon protein GlcG